MGLFLPYTMEYEAVADASRYAQIARSVSLTAAKSDKQAARALIDAIRALETELDAPQSAGDLNISRAAQVDAMEQLVDYAQNDTQIITAPRIPERQDLERLFWYVYEGKPIDF